LRFQIIPRYADDEVKITVRRGKGSQAEEIETTVTLADKLPPYRHAFLGLLPERAAPNDKAEDEGDEAGVVIRAVWPDSPAEEAGVEAGDRIVELGGEDINGVDEALAQLNAKNPGDKIDASIKRGKEKMELEIELAELPVDILSSDALLAIRDKETDDEEPAGSPALEELKLPDMPQAAWFHEPPKSAAAPGLLVWLGDGKQESAEAMAEDWQKACRRDGLILLMPSPGDEAGWSGDDMEYLGRLLQTALQRFDVDRRRIVIAGEGKAGQLAFAIAFRARDTFRGVAVVDSPLPRTLQLPATAPGERLAVLSVETENMPLTLLLRKDLQKLAEAGYPATQVVRRGEAKRDAALDSSTRGKIARWIDGLDRF
jgi:serine protease Do